MATQFKKNLRNDLNEFDEEFNRRQMEPPRNDDRGSNLSKYILLFAFIAVFVYYAGSKFSFTDAVTAPVENLIESIDNADNYSDELLEGMGDWMTDMGYGELTREELVDLRNNGVTATNTSNLRDLGFTDLSLEDLRNLGRADVTADYVAGIQSAGYPDVTMDELIQLQRADASDTFVNMIRALGYNMSVQDLVDLRRAGITAYFTSNLHDLGYADVTKEQLVQMGNVGVSISTVERLIEENAAKPTIEEIIRYRISNQ